MPNELVVPYSELMEEVFSPEHFLGNHNISLTNKCNAKEKSQVMVD